LAVARLSPPVAGDKAIRVWEASTGKALQMLEDHTKV